MDPESSPETELATQLVAGLRAQVPTDASVRLVGIEVEVGVTVDLDRERLHAALRRLLPGMDVQIWNVEVLFKCADCGAEFPADEHPCPVCGSARVAMVHGEELGISRAWGERS